MDNGHSHGIFLSFPGKQHIFAYNRRVKRVMSDEAFRWGNELILHKVSQRLKKAEQLLHRGEEQIRKAEQSLQQSEQMTNFAKQAVNIAEQRINQIVLRLLEKGMGIDFVADFTGLTKEAVSDILQDSQK